MAAKALKQFVRNVLTRRGLSLVSSKELAELHTLLPETPPSPDYMPDTQIGHAGFSLNVDQQLAFLTKLCTAEFQTLFQGIRENSQINTGFGGIDYKSQGLIHNGYFPTPDAELYASFIADYRPERIIEVGSGYSTLIARHTIDHLNLDCTIHVIDPEPRRDVIGYASTVENKRVENSSLAKQQQLDATRRTILFIDSSHVTKLGGDIPFLFCRLLPTLPAGMLVHVHDIFTPFDYPTNYAKRFYTEQYVLQALLANNPNFFVLFTSHFMSRLHTKAMQQAFGHKVGIDPLFFGACFWMRTS